MHKEYFVYIVQCSDGSYYTGITNNVEARVWEHNEGISQKSYTYSRRPVELVYCAEFWDVYDAIAWEKRVKRWTRKKKEALIRGEFEELPTLSLNQRKRRVKGLQLNIREKVSTGVMVSPVEP